MLTKWVRALPLALAIALPALAIAPSAGSADRAAPAAPATHTITYDHYSMMVDGQRIYVFSGEFHPFRLPSPDLWRDIFQKMKASGLNTVSIYFDWGYHSPKSGVYDFSGVRDMDKVLTLAQEAGLYVIARPGPYINAEVNRGGYPTWLVTQQGRARTDAPDYLEAVNQWMTAIDAVIRRHQLTDGGGTVIAEQIENELGATGPSQQHYMQWLHDKVRSDGITVPIFHNDAGRNGLWVPRGSNVPGTVEGPTDLYGFDNYPGPSCKPDNTVSPPAAAPNWGLYSQGGAKGGATASPNTPGFTAEFGGGWFDFWGSNGGYACNSLQRGSSYERLYYGNNVANGLTMQNFYMTFGGTSWGWLPAPVVFTSYDYGAAIDETRLLRPKALTLKQLGEFLQAVPDVRQLDKGEAVTPSSPNVKVYNDVNPNTGAHLYFLSHSATSLASDDHFTFRISTKDGDYDLAGHLKGEDGQMLMAAYEMDGQHLVYSTSEIQTHMAWKGGDLALLYGRAGDNGETVLRYRSKPKVEILAGAVQSSFDAAKGDLKLTYSHQGLARVRISGGGRPTLLLLLADEATAQTFWRQDTAAGGVLERGPALVRTAASKGETLALTGDTSAATPLEVFAPAAVRSLSWNGTTVATRATPSSSLNSAQDLPGPIAITLPDLTQATWRSAAGSPEADPAYDDSAWAPANATTGAGTIAPPAGQPVLAMDAYGFHEGDVWYRGRYAGAGKPGKLTIHYGGGGAGMAQVFVDGRLIGENELVTGRANPMTNGTASFDIPTNLNGAGQHLVAVMVRNGSHNEDLGSNDSQKEPRGLISASMSDSDGPDFGTPVAWKIQGTKGGEDLADPVRGVENNGGLAGERDGWTLPGFPDQAWPSVRLPGAPAAPGTTWYRTSFSLDLPKGQDYSLGLTFGDPTVPRSAGAYRVLIFVNGWNMGQFIANIGPQRTFVVPTGIIDPNGANTVALAVTSNGAPGNAIEAVKLVSLHTMRGGVAVSRVPAPDYQALFARR